MARHYKRARPQVIGNTADAAEPCSHKQRKVSWCSCASNVVPCQECTSVLTLLRLLGRSGATRVPPAVNVKSA